MRVTWSPLAEQRALEAVDYISQDRPDTATEWLNVLLDRVESLSHFAKRGRVVPEIGSPEYREVFHLPYRIIYRVDASEVVILTIRHGRRDWDPAELEPPA